MSKSFRKFIAKPSRNGRWELHPFDAVPVWVPARKPAPRRERKYPRAALEV